ncbi:MAG: bifunctional precorrin-2 dehydrogenase/sirohydrochlorin ferrochelatase [Candidatus Symbiothrix sp.]|jgi:siroheme synthase-like protein|nr:bifunctional precorrin-2 dehydrogenase/sirohydrochlorin ferrochelatase [Candidatus Symbiothrix sp.]
MSKHPLQFLPISINITNKKIVIIGGGKVAFHKATILNRFTSEATIVAPEFYPGFEKLPFQLLPKEYEAGDLNGAFLVYICTGNEVLNAEIKTECSVRGILASVCDNPLLCDFISPAIHKEENMTIAVSSNAQNVRQAIDVRNQLQALAASQLLKIK